MPVKAQRQLEKRNAARLIAPTVLTRATSAGDEESQSNAARSVINGHAVVYGVVTELYRYDDFVCEEVIERGACTKTIARGDDVACVIEHDWKCIVARRSGGSLELKEDETGCFYRATLAPTTRSKDLIADIDHGNIKGSSFRFMADSDKYEEFDRVEPDGNKVRVYKRTIIELSMSDVSPCVWPAYDSTSVKVESDKRSASSSQSGACRFGDLPDWVRDICEKRATERESETCMRMRERLKVAEGNVTRHAMTQRLTAAEAAISG